MNPGDAMLTDQHDSADDVHISHPSHSSFRRRPIVVRDPKTGETRIVGSGGNPTSVASPTAARRPNPNHSFPNNRAHRYRGGFDSDGAYDRGGGEGPANITPPGAPNDDSMGFDDEGRAPIMKIVSGYRGRQIVVRDPSRRSNAPNAQQQPPLGVRGGVRKTSYFDRRGSRSSPYSDEYDDPERQGSGRGFYEREDEEDEERLYSRGRDNDYDRDVDHHMTADYDSRYEAKEYYRNGRSDGVVEDEDLTGKVVYVDNLSDDVTTTGLADLFGMVGAVKELRLLYDRQGNPNGCADIVFQRRADAEEAIKTLHNVPLNKRPMYLSMGNSL